MPDRQWDFQRLSDHARLRTQRLELLPETSFWKHRLMGLFSGGGPWSVIEQENRGITIFSGPVGSGRHMTGSALIGELPAFYGVDAFNTLFLRVLEKDFPESITAEEAADRVDDLFRTAENAPLRIVVFDAMDWYGQLRVVAEAIAKYVEENEAKARKLAVVCYVENIASLPSDLRSLAFVVRTSLPSARQRKEFLQSKISWDVQVPKKAFMAEMVFKDMTVDELAEKTEGMSYGDLTLLIQYIRLSADIQAEDTRILRLNCDRDSVLDCVQMLMPEKPAAGQIVQSGEPSRVSQISGSRSENSVDARAAALSEKENRTFTEDMELINVTD